MSTISPVVKAMLDEVGFATTDEIWAKVGDQTIEAHRRRVLQVIAMKFLNLEGAERDLRLALASLPGKVEREQKSFDDGHQVDAGWILQAARKVEDAAAKQRALCDAISELAFALNGVPEGAQQG